MELQLKKYRKDLKSEPLSGLLGNKYWYFGHPKFTPPLSPLYPPRKRLLLPISRILTIDHKFDIKCRHLFS